MTELHEGGSNGGSKFMHACTIIVFLLIRFLYLLIHSINCLFQSIQFYSVLMNFIDFAAVSSLTACCTQNHLFTQLFYIDAHTQKQLI